MPQGKKKNKKSLGISDSEFLSFIAHQLRTPLISIKWIAEMLLKEEAGELNPGQKEFVEEIYDSSINAHRLLNHLLNITRLESGELKVQKSDVDVEHVYEDVVRELDPILTKKGHVITLEKPKDLRTIRTDQVFFSEILKNLISNAIKYTPDHGTIQVSALPREQDILFSVKDNGIGIPEDRKKNIFEKFFRAENAAKTGARGTGLGLYIVKNFVAMCGGDVWFESEEGKGTTFYFTLPK